MSVLDSAASQLMYRSAMRILLTLICPIFIFAACRHNYTQSQMPPVSTANVPDDSDPHGSFARSSTCANCHTRIYSQQIESMHARSYSNEAFRAHYFREVLPAAADDPSVFQEAQKCAACHMPAAFLKSGGALVTAKDVDERASGVTCDICHRIRDYKGRQPGNGNYIATPGSTKYGPFVHTKTWHHQYRKLHTKSEFCAICHHRTNRFGVLVQPTFIEWQESSYSKKKIQCQDCHMNMHGYLVEGLPEYEHGKAADMVLGSAPERRKLYSHNFPGARTSTQLADAISLRIGLSHNTNGLNRDVAISVEVDNSKAGHRMPSGSIELRHLWLNVHVLAGTNRYDLTPIPVPKSNVYAVSGSTHEDRTILGPHFPIGQRIYRAVFHDQDGRQTDSVIEAATKVFDNRLAAGTSTNEYYAWTPPEGFTGNATVLATIYYRAYPHSFSSRLNIPASENNAISDSRNLISVAPGGSLTFPLENPDW